MTDFEIIDGQKDSSKWLSALGELPETLQDLYYLPNYLKMHRFIKGTQGLLFKYVNDHSIWLYPFLLQPINMPNGDIYYDIETAYGYGGPITNNTDKTFLSNAHGAFSKWCIKNSVIAEFIRFHPLLNNKNWCSSDIVVEFDRETVSVNLMLFDINNPPVNGKVRNMLKRAYRENIKVAIFDPDIHFNQFIDLYKKTMNRINANSFYYFNNEYFSNLLELIKDHGTLIGATLNNEWMGGALFINHGNILHYHLSATNPDNRIPGITNAMILKGIEVGKASECDILHLGGGNSNDPKDSLFSFKKKMGNQVHKHYIGKRIHNYSIYKELTDRWRMAHATKVGIYGKRLLSYRY
jgi:hypothetical protein